VHFSTHYYVLSLGATTNVLFEAFRDSLIDVENQGFPVPGPSVRPNGPARRELARTVDDCFGRYYSREPLQVVMVGSADMRFAFSSVTTHGMAIIGWVEGDHTATSPRDLGQIVWPIVKEGMSGVLERAMRDLEVSEARGDLASGLEAVVRAAGGSVRATLLVEDDYRRKGSISGTSEPPRISTSVDVRDAIDDVVDAVIEKVIAAAGNVVFAPPGTLRDRERIVLLHRGP
jgi:Bacterial archaeo-eukaryotic release factor family 3